MQGVSHRDAERKPLVIKNWIASAINSLAMTVWKIETVIMNNDKFYYLIALIMILIYYI